MINANATMRDSNLNINEVVGYLEMIAPAALMKLRNDFPEYSAILEPGITLGDSNLYSNPAEALVRGLACKAGLENVLVKCKELTPVVKKRLKNLGNLQLGSQVMIGLSGASLLSQLSTTFPTITIISGVLTTFGSIITVVVQHRSGTLLNNSQSVMSIYDKLIDNKFEAEQQLMEIDLALQAYSENNPERLVILTNKSNQICLEIRKIIEKL